MAVTLLRHTTPDVAKGVCYGETDLALAPSFEAEAEAALAMLPHMDCVVSSPLGRCVQLARFVAQARGVDLRIDPDWTEMAFGRWEGLRWDAISRVELDAWAADFQGYDGHGGETVHALESRVRRGLARVSPGTLVVTHMGCIKAALAITHARTGEKDPHTDGWEATLPFGGIVTL